MSNEIRTDFSVKPTEATEVKEPVKPQQEEVVKKPQVDESSNFAFGKINFILIGISMLIVVLGFWLMTGETTGTDSFNPEIFSAQRIKVAPMICLFGFLSVIGGVMYKPKTK